MIECAGPLCDMLVDEAGDTCSIQCFNAWFARYILYPTARMSSIPDVQVPKDKTEQPWYGREVKR